MADNNQYSLITGAAGGIGKSIAGSLAKRGYSLLIIDINERQLHETVAFYRHQYPSLIIEGLWLDISKENAAGEIIKWAGPYLSNIKIVVNNAGYGINGQFETVEIHSHLNIIDTNLKALVAISHAFIPILKNNGKTYLLNVASTTAYQSVPYLSIYAASKAAVLSFTRSLRYELRKSSISVSCLSPGSTDTNFVHRALMGEEIQKLAQKVNMKPDEVAEIALKGLFAGRAEIIPGFVNILNAILPRFFSKKLVERVSGNIYETI